MIRTNHIGYLGLKDLRVKGAQIHLDRYSRSFWFSALRMEEAEFERFTQQVVDGRGSLNVGQLYITTDHRSTIAQVVERISEYCSTKCSYYNLFIHAFDRYEKDKIEDE
jgi:hypothetical protein